jgi:hypothetical protein
MITVMKKFSNSLQHKSVRSIIIFLGVVSLCYLVLGMNRGVNVYDEGLILFGAKRVGNGDIPHADFYCNYGPAQFYLLAGLFKVFSTSILVERVWDTIVRGAIVIMVFLVVEKHASRAAAIATSVISLIWLCTFGFYGYPVFPALLFSLISVHCLRKFFHGGENRRTLFYSGMSVGIITLFRYDLGFIVCVMESATLLAYCFLAGVSDRYKTVKSVCVFWLGIAVIFLPVASAYLAFAPLDAFLYDMVYYPLEKYGSMRSLPFPVADALEGYNLLVYFPVIVWIIYLMVLIKSKFYTTDKGGFWTTLLICLLSMAFYAKGIVRVSVVHMSLSIITALVLFSMIYSSKLPLGYFVKLLGVACLGVCLILTTKMLGNKTLRIIDNVSWLKNHDTQKVPGRSISERVDLFSIDQKRLDAIEYVRRHTQKEEYIYSGTTRHDKVYINDILFYFLSDRPSVTKWHHFDPGVQTTVEVQNEIIAEFENRKPRYIVLESEWDTQNEPNKSSESSGVVSLDVYLKKNYQSVAWFDDITVMSRRVR